MELMVVVGVIGILTAASIPLFITYWRSAAVRAGAQEMRTALQQAKQLAITRRQNVCVQPLGNQYQFLAPSPPGACGGGPLVIPGSDSNGSFSLGNGVTVVGPGIAFTPLGAAAPAGTITVTGPAGNALTVTVSVAGRITTP